MREHPVPQDITGYKFHIIGEMTIKQFAMVAGGVALSFLVNMTNLPALIKWPIMVILTGLGAMAAFVPIEEQPIDHWIATFFKVLYKPTQYYWRRQAKIPDSFKFEQRTKISEADVPADLSPARKERIKEYLFSLDTKEPDEYEQYEQDHIAKLNQSFLEEKRVSPTVVNKTNPEPLDLPEINISNSAPQPEQIIYSSSAPQPEQVVYNSADNYDSNAEEAAVLSVPNQEAIDIAERSVPVQTLTDQELPNNENSSQEVFSQTQQRILQENSNAAAVTHNAHLPFPSKATIPNKIVGMVLSSNNELINDAIIEIKRESGEVLRAVKSNSLGQFFISTPLKNGSYLVCAEKNGFSFPQSRLILEGEIVEPIEIRSF